MPITSFALIVLLALALGALAILAMNAWGVLTVGAILLAAALFARWALAHVPYDDSHP